jgi:long-chain acyl-CoA synthetase
VESDKALPNTHSYDRIVSKASDEPLDVSVSGDDVAIVLYTSGTTGTPKGVMLSHERILLNADLTKDAIGYREDDIFAGVLPMFHSFAFSFDILQMMMVKGSTIIFERFDTKEVVEGIEKYRCTALASVPTMLTYIYNYPDLDKYDLTCLRIGDCGGGPVPVELMETFEDKFGMTVLESYGLTEISPVACVERPDMERRSGSCGLVFPGMVPKIVDPDGKEVPDGQVGELAIKGPTHMLGYFKMPEETQNAIKNGWLYTGDLFRKDNQDYLYFVDRLKHMIVTAGYNIYPKEVENVLYNHPHVLEAAVIGLPDPVKGDIPKAFIVPTGDGERSEKSIIEYCRRNLAAYKVPRIVEFVDSLPQTASGKIKKYALKEKDE